MMTGWEDFPIQRVITSPAVTITEAHVVQFGTLTGDWYFLHFDAEASAKGAFGQRIAHGPLIFSMAVGLMYQSQVFEDSIQAWLGVDNLRATAPVYFGDTIHVKATVIESRPSKQSNRGVVTMKYEVFTQRSESVMSMDYTLFMKSSSES